MKSKISPSKSLPAPNSAATASGGADTSAAANSTTTNSSNHRLSSASEPPISSSSRQRYDQLVHEMATDYGYLRDQHLGKRMSLYRIRGDLGTGNFSIVKLAVHELTNEKVAIKIFKKDQMDERAESMAQAEVINQADLFHPHIIRLYEAIDMPTRLYVATEFAGGGELFFKVSNEGRLSETDARIIFRQIVSAVQYLHDRLICHRDIKPENVLYTAPNWCKLADFGFSTQLRSKSEKMTTFCGSPPYAAPELYTDDNYDGFLADVWSLGIVLYFTVTGFLPFRAKNLRELRPLIIACRYQVPEGLSQGCRELISGILHKLPNARLSIDQIWTSTWLAVEDEANLVRSNSVSGSGGGPLIGRSVDPKAFRKDAFNKLSSEFGIESSRIHEAEQQHGVFDKLSGCLRIVQHRLEKNHTGEPELHDFPFERYNTGYEPPRYKEDHLHDDEEEQDERGRGEDSNKNAERLTRATSAAVTNHHHQPPNKPKRQNSLTSDRRSKPQSSVCSIL